MGKYDFFLPRAGPRSVVEPTGQPRTETLSSLRDGPTFDEILAGTLPAGLVRIGEEAKASLKKMEVELSPHDLDLIGRGIDRLVEAGGRKSVLVGDKAVYTVDTESRTVTDAQSRAVTGGELFVDIDSLVLLDGG